MTDTGAPRILIVGVGNVLHGDDGFGVEVARQLADRELPPGVTVAETGIGGIHLVHELMAGYDALIVVDAVDHGRPPGTVLVMTPQIPDIHDLPLDQRHDLMADMHLATPDLALMIAKAVGVLPDRTLMVGCQPVEIDTLGVGLTQVVQHSVLTAVVEIDRCVSELQASR